MLALRTCQGAGWGFDDVYIFVSQLTAVGCKHGDFCTTPKVNAIAIGQGLNKFDFVRSSCSCFASSSKVLATLVNLKFAELHSFQLATNPDFPDSASVLLPAASFAARSQARVN